MTERQSEGGARNVAEAGNGVMVIMLVGNFEERQKPWGSIKRQPRRLCLGEPGDVLDDLAPLVDQEDLVQ